MKKLNIGIKDKEFLLDCSLILVVLQIGRIIIKNVLLSVLNFTAININIANIISIMIVGISVFLFLRGSNLFNPAGYRLTELSNKYDNKKIRIILFSVTLLSLAITVVLKSEKVFYGVLLICLSTLVIPFYEEMLFRQYLWNYINGFLENEKVTWIIVSILSVLFVLGYWDIISQNLTVITSDKFAIDVVFANMGVSVVTSAIAGFMKYKYKDIYLCLFIHIIISCIFF
ncbi:MAG: CPBP family glutamic-type intramembrane protease [Intestinibacter sp.]|uniref:CPBP family glutamic-type intramembrane protease n=1 Tax=Intestinibacter sp. TaxID=1965304 RepID=UPI0025C65465|nr:CPBP family glutamic-type intramembrane protease [Intestinibacter sp.]MCI6738718.1 CPBP family glutamic-type intramembrane protease [Intestinibacter sp.]